MTLGSKIRTLRLLKGYSQEAMAESLKLSVTGYGKIERDETDVTVSRIVQIADILGIKGEDILRMDDSVFFHNNTPSQTDKLPPSKSVSGVEETLSTCRALYESRISRLEDEMAELRKLIFSNTKPNAAA